MDPDSLSKAFVDHYYSTFDTNRASLSSLYQDSSMLTFEGEKIKGAVNIVNKLTSLPFQQCKHNITTVDCQPSGPAGGMLVFVSGTMQLAGEEHLLKFSQVCVIIRFYADDVALSCGDQLRSINRVRNVLMDIKAVMILCIDDDD
ncbi:nuclear transport factor 2 [Tanacetum coccineum]